MARSVATHFDSVATVYLNKPHMSDDDEDDDAEYHWESFIEDLQTVVEEKYPSFDSADRWVDREVHIIMQSKVAEIGVSEYCGLVSICLAPRDVDNPLNVSWCEQNADKFTELLHKSYESSALISKGRFSNGEQVFAPLTRPDGMVTSKEGTLW